MKPSYPNSRAHLVCALFITGTQLGACQKPATHSETPESTPEATSTRVLTNDVTSSQPSASVISVNEGSGPGEGSSNPQGAWPSALASASAKASLGTSTFQGCLSKPIAAQNAPMRTTKAATATTSRVTPMGNGALVTHQFEHACCLSATTDTSVQGRTVTVHERLTGTPCRCVCDSTIQTRLKLPAGEYEVRLVLDTNGVEAEVATHPLTVAQLSAP